MSKNEIFPNSKIQIPLYHGRTIQFDKFDKSFIGKHDEGVYGKGFYFTDNKNIALNYTIELYATDLVTNPKNVIEVSLNLTNPFYLEDSENIPKEIKEGIKLIYNKKMEQINKNAEYDFFGSTEEKLITNELDNANLSDILNIINNYKDIFATVLKDNGFDGVIVPKMGEYVVFESEQIYIK